MKQYLEIGEVVSTHGVMGEMKVYPWADDADSLKKVKKVFLNDRGENGIKVNSARKHKNMLLLTLEGVESMEGVRKYIGKTLYADRKEIKIEKGAYFIADLLGLEVIDSRDGSHIGKVQNVTNTGVQDIYHVEKDNGEVRMVPGVPAFIKEVNINKGYVAIEPIQGLLEDED